MLKTVNFLGITIDLYKLFFCLGLFSVYVVLFFLRKKFSFNNKRWFFLSSLTLVFGLLSAWITAVIENYSFYFSSNGEYGKEHFENLRNYGIPIFLPLFFLLYSLFFRDKFKEITDYIASSVYSVMTFVKIGCTFQGCCRGEADSNGIMNVDLGYKTFPVQIYDALSSFIILTICILLIYKLRKKHEGYIYPIGGMLFALTKGFWENFRVHNSIYEKHFLGTSWTFWQYWMSILFIGCFIWLILNLKNEKKGVLDYDEKKGLKFPNLTRSHLEIRYNETKRLYNQRKREKNDDYPVHHKKKKDNKRK